MPYYLVFYLCTNIALTGIGISMPGVLDQIERKNNYLKRRGEELGLKLDWKWIVDRRYLVFLLLILGSMFTIPLLVIDFYERVINKDDKQ